MTKITLTFAPYRTGPFLRAEVDAVVRGDLAVHRHAWVGEDGELVCGKSWTVSHIPTGHKLESALPLDLRTDARRADLVAWAEYVQEKCPTFFAEARKPDYEARMLTGDRAVRDLAQDVVNRGRGYLWRKHNG